MNFFLQQLDDRLADWMSQERSRVDYVRYADDDVIGIGKRPDADQFSAFNKRWKHSIFDRPTSVTLARTSGTEGS
jgi:hypothetical protein